MSLIKENEELENKIIELEAQKTVADQRAKKYEDQLAGLEAQNGYLEVLLKEGNEQKADIAPFIKQALLLRNKIYEK